MTIHTAHPGMGGVGRWRGLTLIEVLIALLVLSIGLIGIAALHMTSLKTAHSSYFRSVASVIAVDAEERLWIALADTPPEQAPDIDLVRTEWQAHWAESGIRPPGLAMLLEEIEDSADWTDVRVTVRWTESRLEDVGTVTVDSAEVQMEEYSYRARILKRPDPLPLF